MFVTIASIVTGSILMATVATASLRGIAGKIALDAVCRNNLNRTFDLMAAANNSQTFMFALGKVLDEVKDKTKDAIKAKAVQLTNATSDVVSSDPQTIENQLFTFIGDHLSCGVDVARIVKGSGMPEGMKQVAYSALLAASIAKPPQIGINQALMAQKIEFCMYMRLILDSDSLVDVPGGMSFSEGGGDVSSLKSHPVPQMPSAPDYPRPGPVTFSYGQPNASQYIAIDRPGSKTRARADELCQQLFKKKFYASGDWLSGYVSGKEKEAELQRAELYLNRLASDTRPMGFFDNKS